MSKFTSAFIILLFSVSSVFAKWDPIKGKPHHFGVMITNPLSAASKIGGLLEVRGNLSEINAAVTNYMGVYQGMAYRLEYQKYIRTIYRNEYFWYIRALGGRATYHAASVPFGDNSKEVLGEYQYYGAGGGFGRRWNFNHFFITMNAGLKITLLPIDMTDEARDRFRLFYVTGPGSILDLNFRLGYQF